ncbi:MAG: serine/threonine-protein kinase [Pirellulales bacterium]
MSTPAQPADDADFFVVAAQQSMISDQLSRELAQESASSGVSPARLALDRGALNAVQIDIVETLRRPNSSIPGYQILGVLGYGGMGVVYRARQKNLGRPVALKTVLVSQSAAPTMLARFEQEAMTVAQLGHPNIVVAYDFGSHQGRLYLAMELIDGEDLFAFIQRRERLDERTAWGLARQAAAGLAQAARLGVVHRDVKPGNMLLVEPPEGSQLPPGLPMLKLTDFGLALITTEQEADDRLTLAGSALGTPRYMAPEQFQGSDVDARADIYALGATVYHMLAGSPPFSEKTLPQIMARKLTGEPDPLERFAPGLSPATTALISDMLANNRERRVQSYSDLFERIDRILHDGSLSVDATFVMAAQPALAARGSRDDTTLLTAVPVPSAVEPAPPPNRGPGPRFATMAAAVVGIAALSAWLWLRPPADTGPTVLLTPGAWGQNLYDGETLGGWLPLQGSWSPGRDQEGSRILRGDGVARRAFSRLPPLDNYRLNLTFDLLQANAAELHFALVENGTEQPPRYVLRAARDGVVLGSRGGDRAPLTNASQPLPFPQENADDPNFHEMRVERHATHWLAYFDNQIVGTVPVKPHEISQFRLSTDGGLAFFADVQIIELVPPAPKAAAQE